MSDYKPTPAHIHRQRGRCCKCQCLHCPYGHTIKTLGFKLKTAELKDIAMIQKCLDLHQSTGIAAMLLSQAFKPEKQIEVTQQNFNDFDLVYLKDYPCGVIYQKESNSKKLFLFEDFQDQGIDIETVLSFIS